MLTAHDYEYTLRKQDDGTVECVVGAFPHIVGVGATMILALEDAIIKVHDELKWWKEQFEPAPCPVSITPVSVFPSIDPDGIIGWSRALASEDDSGIGFHQRLNESQPFGDKDAYRTLTHLGVRIFSTVEELITLAHRDLTFIVRRPWRKPMMFPPGIFDATRFVEKDNIEGHPYRMLHMAEEEAPPLISGLNGRGFGAFIRLPEPVTYPPGYDHIVSYDIMYPRTGKNFFDVVNKMCQDWWEGGKTSENYVVVEVYLYGRQRRRS